MIDENLLICWGATHKKLSRGEAVFREGTPVRFYYQVVEGTVKMVNGNEEGKDFIQGIFGAGESFGEPPLFDGKPYPASAIADEPTIVIRLCKDRFIQLLRDNFELHLAFTRLLACRLRFKSMMSRELACYEPGHRVSSLLQYLKQAECRPEEKFRVPFTRQQIADMTGLRVETVIRAIRKMYQDGMVDISRGKVYC